MQSCKPVLRSRSSELPVKGRVGKPTSASQRPKREDYQIVPKYLEEVQRLFPTRKVWRDLFCHVGNACFADFVTDCDTVDWCDSSVIHWTNPPYSMWESVASRIVLSSGEFICLIPDWGQRWLDTLLSLAVKYYVPSGTALFQLDNRRMAPTLWGCWLLHIPPRPRLQAASHHPVTVLPWNLKSSHSKKRRERARRVEAAALLG